MPKASRERRFEATAHVIHRRHFDHFHLDHPKGEPLAIRCLWCEAGPHRWAKSKIRSCPCSKRRHGRPKISAGLCGIEQRDRIYVWRREVRELRRLARGPGFDPEADEVWLMGDPNGEGRFNQVV